MSFIVGDVDLGPTFDVLPALAELYQQAGMATAFDVLENEGESMPEGAPEEAQAVLRRELREPMLSENALIVLRLLAGEARSVRGRPQT